MNKNSLL